MPQDQKFETPQELRQLAEENVERARQLYVQFMDGVGQAMAAWSSASSDVVAPGYREVQEHAVKLANETADAAFRLSPPDPGNDKTYTFQLVQTPTIPEPGTWAMIVAGLLGVGGLIRRRV